MISTGLLLAAVTLGAGPELSWKQTDHSLALVSGEKIVWQFNYDKTEGKPYFHPITVGGGPVLTDLRPADHKWHRALWFSWKFINGLNYWEEDPATGKAQGETELVSAQVAAKSDHSARFELALSYHPPGKPAVLTEKRIIEVTPPAKDGSYFIDWVSTFTAGETEVLLDRTPILGEPKGVSYGGYAGLSLRLSPELKTWHFVGPEGELKPPTAHSPWVAFTGPIEGGKSAGILVLDHPANPRHPSPWYLISGMPYFSPALLYDKPLTLPAKADLTLRYRVLFQPSAVDRESGEKVWQHFKGEGR